MLEERFKVRRKMAKTSFLVVNVLIFVILGMVFFGSEDVAKNLTAASPVLIALIGVLVGIIGHYNHMVYGLEKSDKGKYDVGNIK